MLRQKIILGQTRMFWQNNNEMLWFLTGLIFPWEIFPKKLKSTLRILEIVIISTIISGMLKKKLLFHCFVSLDPFLPSDTTVIILSLCLTKIHKTRWFSPTVISSPFMKKKNWTSSAMPIIQPCHRDIFLLFSVCLITLTWGFIQNHNTGDKSLHFSSFPKQTITRAIQEERMLL